MKNEMKYFKFENGVVIAATDKELAMNIFEQECLKEFNVDNVVELNECEALGCFLKDLLEHESDLTVGDIFGIFDDTKNEILVFGY